MSLVEAWKGLKEMLGGEQIAGDDRQSQTTIEGGRRTGESPNPYLSARRTWNELMQAQVASRRSWELIAILCLLIAWPRWAASLRWESNPSSSLFVPR